MANETQQAKAVGGIADHDGPGAIVDLQAGRHPETMDQNAVYLSLPRDIASAVRLLENMYAHMLATHVFRRGYVDQKVPLQAGVDQELPLDSRPYGYTQVAISATTAANIELFREGVVLSFVLTPGRFATIQQPAGTTIRLKAGDPNIVATFRYSDQIFGVIQP